MSSREKEILVRDSRSENMIHRLAQLPDWMQRSRRRRLLLATSGCLQPSEEAARERSAAVTRAWNDRVSFG